MKFLFFLLSFCAWKKFTKYIFILNNFLKSDQAWWVVSRLFKNILFHVVLRWEKVELKIRTWSLILTPRFHCNISLKTITYIHTYIYIYIYIYKVYIATVAEGDSKAPFSIATSPRFRGRALLLSLDCPALPLIHTL